MMTCCLIYYFLRNCVMYCVRFSGSGFFYVGLYCSGEKEDHQILSHRRKLAAKEHCLGLSQAIMGFCLIIIEFVFSYR